MTIYVIKHKGADWWGNYRHSYEIDFSDDSTIYAEYCFFRLKDAKKYLETRTYPELYEVQRFVSKPRRK